MEERWRPIAVTDASVLADGRVGILVEEGGRWVADGIAKFTVVEEEDAGTPAP